jgi:hypothetical protein
VKGLFIFFINNMGNCYMGNILDTVLVQDMVLELDTDRLHSQVNLTPPQLTLQVNLLQMVRRHIHHIHNHDSDHDARRGARRGARRICLNQSLFLSSSENLSFYFMQDRCPGNGRICC